MDMNLEERQIPKQIHNLINTSKENISIRKMNCLAQDLKKPQVETGVLMATQNFKRTHLFSVILILPFNFVWRRGGRSDTCSLFPPAT